MQTRDVLPLKKMIRQEHSGGLVLPNAVTTSQGPVRACAPPGLPYPVLEVLPGWLTGLR